MKGTGFPEIIEKFDLYPLMHKKTSMTRVVAAMQKDHFPLMKCRMRAMAGEDLAFARSYIGRTPHSRRRT